MQYAFYSKNIWVLAKHWESTSESDMLMYIWPDKNTKLIKKKHKKKEQLYSYLRGGCPVQRLLPSSIQNKYVWVAHRCTGHMHAKIKHT